MRKIQFAILLVFILVLGAASSLSATPRFRKIAIRIQLTNGAPLINAENVVNRNPDKVIHPTMLGPTRYSVWNSTKDSESALPILEASAYNHSSMRSSHNSLLAAVGMVAVMAVVMVVVMR